MLRDNIVFLYDLDISCNNFFFLTVILLEHDNSQNRWRGDVSIRYTDTVIKCIWYECVTSLVFCMNVLPPLYFVYTVSECCELHGMIFICCVNWQGELVCVGHWKVEVVLWKLECLSWSWSARGMLNYIVILYVFRCSLE